ncbi:MAG: serine hydrolase domain-containing protein [Henriciella sp.]|uniref:serine hydrolase domain-containing protein n=1 Tax=Henriciella sp. TaxID=1968823 RepID=UPI003C796C86
MRRAFGATFLAGMFLGLAACVSGPSQQQVELQAMADGFLTENPDVPAVALAVIDAEGQLAGAAAGEAGPDGESMTPAMPVRIASNTKTYVAAAVLRLWEDGEVDLDAPIGGLIDPELAAMLDGDGYDLQAITVRHLLMHVSGMPDHADDAYVAIVLDDTSRQWSRADQVALLVENHDPLGPTMSEFRYSDTGYVLLGDIIERTTGKPLATSVRTLLGFERLGLETTWWEQAEAQPAGTAPRARQSLEGTDTTDWNPSMDMYGGGGLVGSVEDLAVFWAALMRGEIFARPETLEEMVSAPGHPFPEDYRLGVFPRGEGDSEIYFHGGFWGTIAGYSPAQDVAVAGVVTDQAGVRNLAAIVMEMLTPTEAE